MNSDTPCSPSRRAFFRRLTDPLKETVQKESNTVKLPESVYPRPPWARKNSEFLALCTRCNACIDRCPQKVIRTSDELNEHLEALPILTLDYGSCDFCEACVDACTTGALSKQHGIQFQAIATFQGHCQRAYQPFCDFCLEACEAEAITIDDSNIPVINSDLCTGCGECTLSCDSNAFAITKR